MTRTCSLTKSIQLRDSSVTTVLPMLVVMWPAV